MDTDYQPLFSVTPDSWPERWAAIREFTRRWLQIDLPDSLPEGGEAGRAEREMEGVAARLRVRFPPSLREWMRFAEALIARGKFDVFRDNYAVEWDRDHPGFSLMVQVEGDLYWAVRKRNLRLDDPPVDGYGLDYEREDVVFYHEGRVAEHITSFVLGHLFSYLPWDGPFSVNIGEVDETLGELREAFDVYTRWDHLHIFEKKNMLAVLYPATFGAEKLRLDVKLWKPIPRDEVPGYVLEKARKSGWSHGVFTQED